MVYIFLKYVPLHSLSASDGRATDVPILPPMIDCSPAAREASRSWSATCGTRPGDKVNGHDFPGPEVPRAYPYGIYDLGRNAGFVHVGTDHAPARSRWPRSAVAATFICARGGC